MIGNAVGIVIYIVLASRGWRRPEEHGMIPVTGEPFVWFQAVPVLGAFILANMVWGALLIRSAKPRTERWWLITVGVWLLAICVDFVHH